MKDALGHGSDGRGLHAGGVEKLSAEQFQQLVAKSKVDSARADQITAEVRANGGASFEHSSGKRMVVSPSIENKAGLRATSFDEHGEPLGHREYPAHDTLGLRSEVSMALSGGFNYKARIR